MLVHSKLDVGAVKAHEFEKYCTYRSGKLPDRRRVILRTCSGRASKNGGDTQRRFSGDGPFSRRESLGLGVQKWPTTSLRCSWFASTPEHNHNFTAERRVSMSKWFSLIGCEGGRIALDIRN